MRPDGAGRKSQCLQGFRDLQQLKTAEIHEYRFCQIRTWSKGFLRANLRNPLDQRCFLQFFAPNCRYKVDGRLYPNAHSISNPGEVCFPVDISPHRYCTPIRLFCYFQSDSFENADGGEWGEKEQEPSHACFSSNNFRYVFIRQYVFQSLYARFAADIVPAYPAWMQAFHTICTPRECIKNVSRKSLCHW